MLGDGHDDHGGDNEDNGNDDDDGGDNDNGDDGGGLSFKVTVEFKVATIQLYK